MIAPAPPFHFTFLSFVATRTWDAGDPEPLALCGTTIKGGDLSDIPERLSLLKLLAGTGDSHEQTREIDKDDRPMQLNLQPCSTLSKIPDLMQDLAIDCECVRTLLSALHLLLFRCSDLLMRPLLQKQLAFTPIFIGQTSRTKNTPSVEIRA